MGGDEGARARIDGGALAGVDRGVRRRTGWWLRVGRTLAVKVGHGEGRDSRKRRYEMKRGRSAKTKSGCGAQGQSAG